MRKSKIVLDSTPLLYGKIGLSRVIEGLVEAIIGNSDHLDITLYSRSFSKLPNHNLNKRLPYLHYPLPRMAEKFISRFGMTEWLTKGDLFHATDHFMPLKYPERAIVTIHDLIFLKDKEKKWEAHSHFMNVVPQFAKRSKGIITISEASKNDIVEFFQVDPEKVKVIPWGIDFNIFSSSEDPEKSAEILEVELGIDKPYFLAIGSHIPRKNAKNTLLAYLELAKNNPLNDLLFVGNSTPELDVLLQKSPQKDRVEFLGQVTDEHLVLLYQNASAFLFPSTLEGFGCPVLEAMACGAPVITSSSSSLPEVGGSAANYVDPLDVTSIYREMEKVENNDPQIREKVDISRDWVKKFSWEECAKRHLKIYKSSLGKIS